MRTGFTLAGVVRNPFMTYPALLRRLAGVLLLFVCFPAFGADAAARRDFRLSGGDAAVTLKQFTEQSGEQVMYLVDSVRGVTTRAVRGRHAPREARAPGGGQDDDRGEHGEGQDDERVGHVAPCSSRRSSRVSSTRTAPACSTSAR